MDKKYLKQFKDFLDEDTTKSKLTKVVLCAFAVSTLPVVAFGAAALGNGIQIVKMFNKGKKYNNKQISDTITNLKNGRYIEYVSEKNGKIKIRITNKGKSKLHTFMIDMVKINKPNKWDRKWRMVMFDLPIRFSKARNSLRFKLKQLGFIQFQKSVWIYPYPCMEEILFVADYYKVGKYVEILEISSLNNDSKLRKRFNL
ncbi:MAG: hypothetical protein WCT42_03585 [Candidatus Paceibacterota bacterium]